MLGPEAARKGFVKEIFGVVHVHLDFFEDNLLLVLDVTRIEARVKAEVADNIQSDREMLIENFGVEADLLFGGEGVQHAADGIHFSGDGFGGTALGALEDHVLDEMGKAVLLGDFAAGAVANPDANGDGAHVGHRLGDDNETVGEHVALDIANLRGHGGIVTQGRRQWPVFGGQSTVSLA